MKYLLEIIASLLETITSLLDIITSLFCLGDVKNWDMYTLCKSTKNGGPSTSVDTFATPGRHLDEAAGKEPRTTVDFHSLDLS